MASALIGWSRSNWWGPRCAEMRRQALVIDRSQAGHVISRSLSLSESPGGSYSRAQEAAAVHAGTVGRLAAQIEPVAIGHHQTLSTRAAIDEDNRNGADDEQTPSRAHPRQSVAWKGPNKSFGVSTIHF
jgi:hypothetical protein